MDLVFESLANAHSKPIIEAKKTERSATEILSNAPSSRVGMYSKMGFLIIRHKYYNQNID